MPTISSGALWIKKAFSLPRLGDQFPLEPSVSQMHIFTAIQGVLEEILCQMATLMCTNWAQSCFMFDVIILQQCSEVCIQAYSRAVAAEDSNAQSLKAQKGTLIMRQIEGLGVGLLAKTGSKLSRRYGNNRAFQEFQLQHEPAFLTQHTHHAILLAHCLSMYLLNCQLPFFPFCFQSPPSFPHRSLHKCSRYLQQEAPSDNRIN